MNDSQVARSSQQYSRRRRTSGRHANAASPVGLITLYQIRPLTSVVLPATTTLMDMATHYRLPKNRPHVVGHKKNEPIIFRTYQNPMAETELDATGTKSPIRMSF